MVDTFTLCTDAGSVCYENTWGGRVRVCGHRGDCGVGDVLGGVELLVTEEG